MSTTEALREQRVTHLKHAQAVLARVKASGREFPSQAEHDEMTTAVEAAKSLDSQIAKQVQGKALVDSVVGLTSVEDLGASSGSLFSETDRAGIVHAAKSRTTYRAANLDSKALLTTGTLLPTSGTFVEGGLHPNSAVPHRVPVHAGARRRPDRPLLPDDRRDRRRRRRGCAQARRRRRVRRRGPGADQAGVDRAVHDRDGRGRRLPRHASWSAS